MNRNQKIGQTDQQIKISSTATFQHTGIDIENIFKSLIKRVCIVALELPSDMDLIALI